MPRHTRTLIMITFVGLLLNLNPIYAAPLHQDDPEELCRQGGQLFRSGQYREALPLLEAGVANGERDQFSNPDDLGICAVVLGLIRSNTGDARAELDAYMLALPIFQQSGNREWESMTLIAIGTVYRNQGRLDEALDYFQQALSIAREVGDRLGEGTILNSIGTVYGNQGRFTDALASYQQALAIRREIGDREGEGVTLSNIGGVYRNQGRLGEALDFYQQALSIQRESGDREGEGGTLSNIGFVYTAQGRMAEALDYLQQALSIRREVGDRKGEGTTLNHIGAVYADQGRYAEALDAYQQALSIAREIGDREDEGGTLSNIGRVYADQGRYAEALDAYQQALTIAREFGNRQGEGATLSNIGAVYQAQGRLDEALDSHQQALSITREVNDRRGEGDTLNNIGNIYRDQGRLDEALDYLQQALSIQREVGKRREEGITLNNIGLVYLVQGRLDEALDYYQQALSIRREVGDRSGEGATLNNIGTVYDDQGRLDDALDYLQQALSIRREVGDRKGEGDTLNNIGGVYYAQGRLDEALEQFQQALSIRREVGDREGEGTTLNNIGGVYYAQGRLDEALEQFQQALTIWREVGNRPGEGRTLNNIGAVYQAQGRLDEALDSFQQAMDILEAVRASAGSDEARASFIAQYAFLYEQTARLAVQQGQGELAFFTSERGRARAFLDGLATGSVQLADDAAQQLFEREQETYRVRQATQEALSRARIADPPDAALVADLEAQLAAAEASHAVALQAIVERGEDLVALIPARTQGILDVAAVQARLDPQTTLVSFFVGETESLAFVLTPTSFTTVVLDVGLSEVTDAVSNLRATLSPQAPAHDEEQIALYQTLFAPLKEYLNTPHVAIIPHGPLHYLPFAALSDGEQYLGDQFTLSFLPSASVLPFVQANQGRALTAPLVLGNPDGSLPGATREAQTIANLFGNEPLLGAAASKQALHDRVAEAGILHIAAHGSYNPVAPLFSHLALAPDGDGDGNLTTAEVYSLDLHQSALVVLSACETNLGAQSAGDELVGMTRAFLFAGTPTVVSSLWRVDDAASALLMERFYQHLQAGMGKAQALQQAQADVRAQYPAPYSWAGFVLSGDAGRVDAAAPTATTAPTAVPPPWWLWLAAGLVLLVMVVAGGIGVLRWRTDR